jgi:hypothetical protein
VNIAAGIYLLAIHKQVDHAEQQPASKKLKPALQQERLGNFFPQITQRRYVETLLASKTPFSL